MRLLLEARFAMALALALLACAEDHTASPRDASIDADADADAGRASCMQCDDCERCHPNDLPSGGCYDPCRGESPPSCPSCDDDDCTRDADCDDGNTSTL